MHYHNLSRLPGAVADSDGLCAMLLSLQDVFVDGFAFRLLLSTEREVEVRKKLHGEAAVVKQPPSLNLALRSWHHGAMAMLDGQHPAFAPTVRYISPCLDIC